MRTESVTVRPFFNVPLTIACSLADAGIRFVPDEEFQIEPAVKVALEVHETELQIQLPSRSLEVMKEFELSPRLQLDCVLADETRRISRLLGSVALKDVSQTGILSIPTQNVAIGWNGRKGGCLSVFLALSEEGEAVVGLPHRYGQILSMKHFSINKSAPGSEFPVEFWAAERFEKEGFNRKASAVVIGDPEALTEMSSDDVTIQIGINEKLRSAFAHARRSRRANVLQDSVGSLVVTQLLMMAKTVEVLDEKTVGHRMVKQVLAASGKQASSLAQMTDSQIVAAAQVYCELTESGAQVS
jgi:hypothetical protein